ncbi:MAG TPA: DNA polymerase [Thermomicrobiales bacterium]|nr:DNA polymerase [Thermomicrobiales bacterium]
MAEPDGGKTGNNGDAARPTLLLIDGYGLIFRAYHAMPAGLATSKGEQTNAVFGFAQMLLDVLRREQPDYAVIALEGGPIFREEMYADYKAHRGPMPDDLRPQVARVQELIGALNIPIERLDGYEADDVIGSLARKYGAAGEYRVVIVTGDSDLLQLVDDNVTVVLPGGQRFEDIRVFDRPAVEARYGFAPERVADYKALVGDTSDNIPGVPGIGDKTAKALIGRFGGIEEIIAHAEEIEPARARNAVSANAEAARLSLRLATIVRDLPVALDLERSAVGNYQRDDVIAILRDLEFGPRILAKLPEARPARAAATKAARPPSRRTIVRTADELAALAARVREVGAYAVDAETDSLDALTANLVGIAIGVGPDEGAYIPVGHDQANAEISPDEIRAALLPLLTDDALRGFAHHAKYDLEVLRQHGYEFTNLAFETMLAAFLLGAPGVGLKELAFNRLGREMTEILELIGPRGRGQLTMNQVAADAAGEYAAADVEATFELAELLRPEIEREGMTTLLYDIEQPLVPVLADMEEVGIAVDVPFLHELAAELTARSRDLEREIYALAGREFKINSPQQLSGLLFDELKLPPGRRTKTGYSVDADVLEAIRERHPIVDLILENRALAKFLSTYVEALPKQVSPRDGRVHTSYSQTVAATGRLSSSNPNLQNIPIRTAEGRRIRRAFIADHRPDHRLFDDAVLVSAD